MQLTYFNLDEYKDTHSGKPFAYRPPVPSRLDAPSFFDSNAAPFSYVRSKVDSLTSTFNYSDTATDLLNRTLHCWSLTTEQNFTIDVKRQMLNRLRNSVARAARLHCAEIANVPAIMDTRKFSPEDHRAYKRQMAKYAKTHKALFTTLTYADDIEWDAKHMSNCISAVKMWHKRLGIPFRYVWVAEVQEERKIHSPEQHCVHYHLIIWLPKRFILPYFDARGWWPYGSTNCKKSYSPIGYLMKYASKGLKGDYTFPKGCRKHGCGGLTKDHRRFKTWHSRPSYVKEAFPDYRDNVQPAKGGGWIAKQTGEFLDAAWDLVSISPLVIRPKNKDDKGKRSKTRFSFSYSSLSVRLAYDFLQSASKFYIPFAPIA